MSGVGAEVLSVPLTGYARGARRGNGLAAHLTVTCASCLLSHPLASLAEVDAIAMRVAKAARVTYCSAAAGITEGVCLTVAISINQ